MAKIRIQEDIFGEYPTFRRGIVVAKNINNRGPSEILEAKLEEAIAKAGKQPIDIKSDPRTPATEVLVLTLNSDCFASTSFLITNLALPNGRLMKDDLDFFFGA